MKRMILVTMLWLMISPEPPGLLRRRTVTLQSSQNKTFIIASPSSNQEQNRPKPTFYLKHLFSLIGQKRKSNGWFLASKESTRLRANSWLSRGRWLQTFFWCWRVHSVWLKKWKSMVNLAQLVKIKQQNTFCSHHIAISLKDQFSLRK